MSRLVDAPPRSPATPLLEMRGIRKEFPGVVANAGIDFELHAGEVHALLGENGAGKTTLMRILYGLEAPDEGEIRLNGHPVRIDSPADAIRLGIGMVHQHFTLVPTMTVLENIVLGLPSPRGPFLDLAGARRRLTDLAESLGFQVFPEARISHLSVGAQQRVELLKALYREVRVLILDEPTAVLTPGEVRALFMLLRDLADRRLGVVLITHKLGEVLDVSSRITVLRQGRRVSTVYSHGVTERQLAAMMVGRELLRVEKSRREVGEPLLRVEELSAVGERGLPALDALTFVVMAGEIVGLAGVDGNGQQELAEVIAGLRRSSSGRILLRDKEMTMLASGARRRLGLGFIPEDRQRSALAPDLTVLENAILHVHHRPACSRHGLTDHGGAARYAQQLMETFDVRAAGRGARVRTLSGGNQQKLVLARELALSPQVLVAAQPTRGLDVAATEFVHRRLLDARDQGKAVLLISTDLDEVLALSDRILVLHGGRIAGEMNAENVNLEEMGLLMAGAARTADAV